MVKREDIERLRDMADGLEAIGDNTLGDIDDAEALRRIIGLAELVMSAPVGTWHEPMPAWVAIPDSAKPDVYRTWSDGQRVKLVLVPEAGGGEG